MEFVTFILVFIAMEGVAWWLHKYVMHGPLWFLHEDHHHVNPTGKFEKNDLFAIFFAIPSFFMILIGNLGEMPHLMMAGYGVMAYGFAYFFVHEVLIHRRWKFMKTPRNKYVTAVNIAHKIHHSVHTKEGCKNFGMVFVPIQYFRQASLRSRGA
jgi:beta-carotene 3-hydroxylase